jgi:hypothetical protein
VDINCRAGRVQIDVRFLVGGYIDLDAVMKVEQPLNPGMRPHHDQRGRAVI